MMCLGSFLLVLVFSIINADQDVVRVSPLFGRIIFSGASSDRYRDPLILSSTHTQQSLSDGNRKTTNEIRFHDFDRNVFEKERPYYNGQPFGNPAGYGGYTSLNDPNLRAVLHQMVNVIDNIDMRLRRMEEKLAEVNLLDIAPPTLLESPTARSKCKGKQDFFQIGDHCLFISVWNNQRANWKEAEETCKQKGGILLNTLSHPDFVYITDHLAKSIKTAGVSYWMGGVHLGLDWMWISNGQSVTLNPFYWRTSKENFTPGDIKEGQCLSLYNTYEDPPYIFKGDKCIYKKFFICQVDS